MRRHLLLIVLSAWVCGAMGQRRIVVYDIETRTPIRKVLVWADMHLADSTDYQGHASLPDKFDTLMISKPGYIALRIPARSVRDSIPLLPRFNSISEVVVYGDDRARKLQSVMERWTKEQKTEYALRHPKTGISFDLGTLFDFRGRRARKRQKRLEQIWKQEDARRDDPVWQAYREVLGEREQP